MKYDYYVHVMMTTAWGETDDIIIIYRIIVLIHDLILLYALYIITLIQTCSIQLSGLLRLEHNAHAAVILAKD
jgi:hypothetical protein